MQQKAGRNCINLHSQKTIVITVYLLVHIKIVISVFILELLCKIGKRVHATSSFILVYILETFVK